MNNFVKWLFPVRKPTTLSFEESTNDLRVCDGRLQRRIDVVVERYHYGWEWPETISRVPEWRDVPAVSSVG